jgi:biotin synthase
MHPGMSYENRFRCLDDLKDIRYQSGSGFIVGLKGQTDEMLASDMMYLKETKPHMIGLGPFIPHGETPLSDCSMGSTRKTLICMAMVRLLVPDVLMPVTTALSVLRPKDGLEMGLQAGANVIMLNFTPPIYREGYQIYDGKSGVRDVAKGGLRIIEREIEKAGYRMDLSRGDSQRML